MLKKKLTKELEQIDKRWNKLIFVCSDKRTDISLPISDYEELNINFIISEGLLEVPKEKYSFNVLNIIHNKLKSYETIYFLNYIDILFDPVLKINPVRLFENLSKENKIIVNWPGSYNNGNLIYANFGHPEYYICDDYEGKIIEI